MASNGIFKNSSFIIQICFFIATIFAGSLFSYFLMIIYLLIQTIINGLPLEIFIDSLNNLVNNANDIRTFQLLQSLATFLFPALFIAKLYSDDKRKYLQMDTQTPLSVFALTMLSMIAILPFLNLTVAINEQMKLPEALSGLEKIMSDMETQMQATFNLILKTDNIITIILNFLIIAVLAAIGEEFIFRGVLQNIFSKLTKNIHIIIWIVAIIFSSVHFQFYGFIPRMLLGAYFGYLLYFTKNIWIPVLAHFTNNAISLIGYYTIPDDTTSSQIDAIGTGSSWYYAVISLFVWLFFFIALVRINKSYRLSS